MHRLVITVLLFGSLASAQSKIETITNFGLRSADVAQTCYQLKHGAHEDFLPTQSCAGIAAISYGFATSSYLADRWLIRHHHDRLAHLQLASGVGAAIGIAYTFGGVK